MDWCILLFGPIGILDATSLLSLPPLTLASNIIFLRQKLLQKSFLQHPAPVEAIPIEIPSLKNELQQLLWKKVRQALPPQQKYVHKTYYEVFIVWLSLIFP